MSDEFVKMRSKFYFPKDKLYFSSHQCGLMSTEVKDKLNYITHTWETKANGAWGDWMPIEESLINNLATLLNVPS